MRCNASPNGWRNLPKLAVKKSLHAFGLDIVRLSGEPADVKRFAPSKENEFIWLFSLGIRTIIDIGAHVGEFAMKFHEIIPDASIISFEPLEESFRQLKNNMNNVPHFEAIQCALGHTNTTQEMYRNDFGPSSSLLRMTELHKRAFPFTKGETPEMVPVRRLDDVLKDFELRNNILIKIDVQGYEDKVILGGADLVARAKLVIVEVSFHNLYEGQPSFDDLYQSFNRQGFRYIGNFHQLRSPLDGRVLQADAMFSREAPGRLIDERGGSFAEEMGVDS